MQILFILLFQVLIFQHWDKYTPTSLFQNYQSERFLEFKMSTFVFSSFVCLFIILLIQLTLLFKFYHQLKQFN